MLDQTYLFAAVAGYVGRPDASGAVGIFRRPAAAGGEWQQVLDAPECHYAMIHPANPDLVFAGADDGAWARGGGPVSPTPWLEQTHLNPINTVFPTNLV